MLALVTIQEESVFIVSILQKKKLRLERLITHPSSHTEGTELGFELGESGSMSPALNH